MTKMDDPRVAFIDAALWHGPIESARAVREAHDLRPEQIAAIRLRLDKSCERVCNIPAPSADADHCASRRRSARSPIPQLSFERAA